MSALSILSNIRSLRAQARETSLDTLGEVLEKLSMIVEERREEESSVRKEQEERLAKLEAIRAKLLEEGIEPEELIAAHQPTSTKRNSGRQPRQPKYKYTDENGSEYTWTGQGRTPKIIVTAIKNGKTLDEFEIK